MIEAADLAEPEWRLRRLQQQQASIADFARQALSIDDADALLQEAAVSLATGLDVKRSKVMEVLPGGTEVLIRAGIGWMPGVVGHARVDATPGSAAAYTLSAPSAVITQDVGAETRFRIPEVLLAHGISSFINVPIRGESGPFGILEADAEQERSFTADDLNFLQGYAHLVAAALQRLRSTRLLREAEEQKARLLRELQHRVKNNLQVVSNLHTLQARRTKDPEARRELEVLATRVEALRLLHDKLYFAEQTGQVQLQSYLGDLCRHIVAFHSGPNGPVQLDFEVADLTASIDTAAPLGLIVNEFLTNSMKHAFVDRGSGQITVHLEHSAKDATLTLADDGIGMPAQPEQGLGLRLIPMLAAQFGAEVQWDPAGKARATISFPI